MLFNPRKKLEPHLIDALDALRIELAAVKGRWRAPEQIDPMGRDYLQLGCGDNLIDGFLNTDYFMNPRAEAWIDMRFPLRFPDSAWTGVFAHHSVEHIDYPDAFKLFKEILRVLKPGGVFRMAVPDIGAFIKHYSASNELERRKIFTLLPPWAMKDLEAATPLEIVDYAIRDNKFNKHLSSWDWETADLRLREAGFSKVVRQEANISLDERLASLDNLNWKEFSLYVEAVK